MAVLEAEIPGDVSPKLLTYKAYLSEGVVYGRYEIIDGVRRFMPNPTPLHQEIAMTISEYLRVWQRKTKVGRTFMAPRDVLVHVNPMRTRQPDVLFISNERIGGQPLSDPAPFGQAPELVVEVLSDSDTRQMRFAKIRDFCAVGVNECWLVSPETEIGGSVAADSRRASTRSPLRPGPDTAKSHVSRLDAGTGRHFSHRGVESGWMEALRRRSSTEI